MSSQPRMARWCAKRMSNLNHRRRKFDPFELNEREQTMNSWIAVIAAYQDAAVRSVDERAARSRFAERRESLGLAPEADSRVMSATEIAFRLHGLELPARECSGARIVPHAEEISFGVGPYESSVERGE